MTVSHWAKSNIYMPLGICLSCHPACTGEIPDRPGFEENPGASSSGGEPGFGDSPTGGDETAPTSTTTTTTNTTTSSTGPTLDTDATAIVTTGDGVCGDGLVDADEACDDGDANGDDAACTDACTLNVCGDGFHHVGVEECDEGVSNSDSYGHPCTTHCMFGKVCGDGIVQAESGEECETTDDTAGEDGGPYCEACHLTAFRGFITSESFSGDLDGLEGADEKCRAAATNAGLSDPHRFRAWISSADVSANTRFDDKIGDDRRYVLLSGLQFADSYTDLVTHGPGDTGIHITEHTTTLTGAVVATNTRPNGNIFDAEPSCASWQSVNKNLTAYTGFNALPKDDPLWQTWKNDGWWAGVNIKSCDSMYFHLYCLE